MSINIKSNLDNENNFWGVSLEGELDISTADKLKEHLHKLADEINSEVYHYIPRDKVVQISENNGKTVIEQNDTCEMANIYLDLAKKIINE